MKAWRVRLHEELRTSKNNYFITLTIDDENYIKLLDKIKSKYDIDENGYKMQNLIATEAVRRWLENIRSKTKKSIKHWLVTELGQNNTERIHLHGVLFEIEDINLIMQKWLHGTTWIGQYVNEKTINYIGKYLTKLDKTHMAYTPIILTSKGIGANYLNRYDSKNNKFNGTNTNELYKTRSGHTINLPIYYRNKIYSETEREQLWLNKLNKQERYVLGNKIDISKNDDEYEKALIYARTINKKQGWLS